MMGDKLTFGLLLFPSSPSFHFLSDGVGVEWRRNIIPTSFLPFMYLLPFWVGGEVAQDLWVTLTGRMHPNPLLASSPTLGLLPDKEEAWVNLPTSQKTSLACVCSTHCQSPPCSGRDSEGITCPCITSFSQHKSPWGKSYFTQGVDKETEALEM